MRVVDIKRIEFAGLARFAGETLAIDFGTIMTTFVGPNGCGKSTLLEAAAELLCCVAQGWPRAARKKIAETIGLNPKYPTEAVWETAKLTMIFRQPDEVRLGKKLGDILRIESGEQCTISFALTESTNISGVSIEVGNQLMIKMDALYDGPEITEWEAEFADINKKTETLQAEIDTTKKALAGASPQGQSQKYQQRLRKAEANLKQHLDASESRKAHLQQLMTDAKNSQFTTESGSQVPVIEILDFLRSLLPGGCRYFHGSEALYDQTTRLENHLRDLKNKAHSEKEKSPYNVLLRDLRDFLKGDATTSGESDKFKLHLDNLSFHQLSTGTRLGVAFFGLMKSAANGGIILWDEPENSLHPSRRIKVRSLMLQDHDRQYIVASHATEFCPVFESACVTYRLSSTFNSRVGDEENGPICSIRRVGAELSEAFRVAEGLGLQPAQALFTANCVIWVEGPSDLIYLRTWLGPHFKKEGLLEGFDYTFMFYGGSLLARLTTEDKQGAPTDKSLANLLNIVPASIVVCDSDVRSNNAESIQTIEANPNKQQAMRFYPLRVQRLSEICASHGENGAAEEKRCRLIVTHGRSIENWIPEAELKDYLNYVANRECPQGSAHIAFEDLTVGRWDDVMETVGQHLNQKLTANRDNWCGLQSIVGKKVPFAQGYAQFHDSQEIEETEVRPGLDLILKFVKEAKERYLQ